jgi:NAD-dependent dihydropyrimidine dehydrogenase PreA subunit
MALREIIKIDEERCDGCGLCVSACAEGAIALIDGKARLVSEIYCDGLGACLGHCPQGAITVEKAEAANFDERAVERHLAAIGRAPLHAHDQAPTVAPRPEAPVLATPAHGHSGGCPGSRMLSFAAAPAPAASAPIAREQSTLRQWPVQLHLVSPHAPYFRGADLLLTADCVPFAFAGFHRDHLVGHSLAIACPKLDSNQEVYLDKLIAMIDGAQIRSITVMIMEVPCCGGLARLAQAAVARAQRQVSVRVQVVSVRGEILSDSMASAQATEA